MTDSEVPRPTPWNEAGRPRRPADNGPRFVAFLIDAGIAMGIYFVGLAVLSASEGLGALVVFVGSIGFFIYNYMYLQGTTGQTIGKKQMGVILLRDHDGQPVGAWMVFVRMVVIAIFAIPCYLDYWWILVDGNNRRLSDKVLSFQVLTAEVR